MEIDFGKYRHKSNESALGYVGLFNSESALGKIEQEKFSSFVTGVLPIYEIISKHENPDYILAPMRGAGPLVWTLETIAEKNNDDLPPVVGLPIGTNTDIYNSKVMKGLKKPEKQNVIDNYLQTLYELDRLRADYGIRPCRLLLLDEARTGGAVSTATKMLNIGLKKYPEWQTELSIIVCHDCDYKRETHLNGLISNKYGRCHKVALPMPQIDVTWLLPVILRQEPSVRSQENNFESWELLEVVENQKARDAYRRRVLEVLEKL